MEEGWKRKDVCSLVYHSPLPLLPFCVIFMHMDLMGWGIVLKWDVYSIYLGMHLQSSANGVNVWEFRLLCFGLSFSTVGVSPTLNSFFHIQPTPIWNKPWKSTLMVWGARTYQRTVGVWCQRGWGIEDSCVHCGWAHNMGKGQWLLGSGTDLPAFLNLSGSWSQGLASTVT